MGKSTQLRLIGGKEPRQYMWEALRDNRTDFTIRQIADLSKQPEDNVKQYVRALNKAAFVELLSDTGLIPDHRWRLIRDEGAEHPRVNSSGARSKHGLGTEGLWRSLRIMGEMTAAQAAEMASVNGVKVSQAHAMNYFGVLVRAGYLTVTPYDYQGPQTFKFAPGVKAGPRHPVVQRTSSLQVFDPNLNKVVFSQFESGGVSTESTPTNDLQEENIRLRELLSEVLEAGKAPPPVGLLQRIQLELA